MTPPRWTCRADAAGWSLSYGDVVIASSTSQKRTVGDAIARLVADMDATLDDLADANAAADALTAWASTVKGRGTAA
jgi:hypothetical protein